MARNNAVIKFPTALEKSEKEPDGREARVLRILKDSDLGTELPHSPQTIDPAKNLLPQIAAQVQAASEKVFGTQLDLLRKYIVSDLERLITPQQPDIRNTIERATLAGPDNEKAFLASRVFQLEEENTSLRRRLAEFTTDLSAKIPRTPPAATVVNARISPSVDDSRTFTATFMLDELPDFLAIYPIGAPDRLPDTNDVSECSLFRESVQRFSVRIDALPEW